MKATFYYLGASDASIEGEWRWRSDAAIMSSVGTEIETSVSWTSISVSTVYNAVGWYGSNKLYYQRDATVGYRYICQHRRIYRLSRFA